MSAVALALWLRAAAADTDTAAPAPAAGTVETFEYTVRDGDTCAAIAKRFFGDAKRYDIIHQYNPGMGPTPHDLKAGRILILPKVATAKNSGPDAEVTASRRRVEARAANEDAWRLAAIGLDLFRGWRVNTLPKASAELTFRDTSVLELRENTLVIIFGSTQTSARRTTTEASLDRGALRSRLGELSGGASLKVEMPAASAELEGGRALVTVDDAGTSRLANHGKGKASVADRPKVKKKKPKAVKVAGGMGSKVEAGKTPTPPHRLPPAPAWAPEQRTRFVSIPAAGASVAASWVAEPKAASYRIEVARKPDGRDVVADAVAPGTVTAVELHGLPPGEYWMSVASIDRDKFEGIPNDALALRVVEGAMVLPDGTAFALPAPDADTDATAAALDVPRGTILRAPAGLTCRLGDATPAAEVTLVDPGTASVSCTESEGGAIAKLDVDVLPWTLALPEGAPAVVPLVVAEPRDVEFSLASASYSIAALQVDAPAGIRVGAPVSLGDGRWRVQLTADAATPPGELVLRTPAGVELQRIAYTVEAPVVTAPVATPKREGLRWIERWTPERNMWELGVYGGVMVPSRNLELFEADPMLVDQGFQHLRRVAPDFGARVGYFPLRVLGVEVEGGAMPTRTASDDRATLFTARAHVIGRLGLSSITPFLLAGLGVVGVDGDRAALGRDVDAAMHFGGGLEIFTHRRVAVRFDVRDVVTAKRGVRAGLSSSFEALLGLSVTLGRKQSEGRLPAGRPVAVTPVATPIVATPEPAPAPQPTPTPEPAPVVTPPADPNADRDGDGIVDATDACVDAPETANGFDDADGCPDELPKALADFAGVIEGIAFATASDVITPGSKPTLDHAFAVLKEFPTVRVRIAGHTDNVGKRAANVDLSQRRAAAVRKYLVDAGIDAARLETRGAGPDEPVASNKTKDGRAKNRRIEFELIGG